MGDMVIMDHYDHSSCSVPQVEGMTLTLDVVIACVRMCTESTLRAKV